MGLTTRGVSPVVGSVLLIGLVAALAAGVLAAGTAMESLDDPPPAVVAEADDIRAACAGCGPADQVVRLHHRSGDAVPMADTAVVVAFPDRSRQARLVDLPLPTNCLRDSHVEGSDFFDGRCGRVSGSLTAVGPDADGTWSAGDTIVFRLRKGAFRLTPGDEVTVRLLHTPSETVLIDRTVSATG